MTDGLRDRRHSCKTPEEVQQLHMNEISILKIALGYGMKTYSTHWWVEAAASWAREVAAVESP